MGGNGKRGANSGSSGAGDGSGGGGGGMFEEYSNPIGSKADCANLSFPATLKQVQPTALSKVEEGDLLPISVRSGNICQVVNHQGEPCGTIISSHMNDLAECIGKGFIFEAAILSIRGEECKISVRNAR